VGRRLCRYRCGTTTTAPRIAPQSGTGPDRRSCNGEWEQRRGLLQRERRAAPYRALRHSPASAAECAPGEGSTGQATRQHVFVGYPNATRLNSLLSQICVERGWCIAPDDHAQVRQAIAGGADAVVDTLIRIELQIEPVMCDKRTHRWLYGKVVDWLFDPRGRGASSGLPL
jgi:hypothetical protein